MPFPAGLQLVAVHGRLDTLPSGGAAGTVRFECPYTLVGTTDNSIVGPFVVTAGLDASGEFTISLPATNDPQWTPVNWAYSVRINVGVATISGTLQLDYQTTTVELADLLQVDGAAVTGTTYIPLSYRGVASGVAALDADGDVNNAAGNKITGGAGGGISETIVNAKGDLIAATANDAVTRLAVGSDGQLLTAASGQSTGLQWAAVTASSISDSTATGRSVLTAADAAAARTAIGAQPSDADLTTIAGLTATTDNMIQSVGSAWASRTPAQVKSALAIGISDVASLQAGLDGKVDESVLTTKGDLYVATASATPARLGVGTNDHVLTADSTQATGVKWAAAAGGGTAPTFARAVVTAGDVVAGADAGWVIQSGLSLAIAAAAGDDVTLTISGLIDFLGSAADFYDPVVVVSSAIARAASTNTATPATEGDPSLYPDQDVRFRGATSVWSFTVQAGDLEGGNVTFGLAHKGATGGSVIKASASYPFRWMARNDH